MDPKLGQSQNKNDQAPKFVGHRRRFHLNAALQGTKKWPIFVSERTKNRPLFRALESAVSSTTLSVLLPIEGSICRANIESFRLRRAKPTSGLATLAYRCVLQRDDFSNKTSHEHARCIETGPLR